MATLDTQATSAAPVAAPERSGAAGRRRGARLDVDPLGIVGLLLLVGVWYLATLTVSRLSLPLPQDVLGRLSDELTTSYQMTSFGIQSEGYLGNLLYTAQNVVVAVAVGSILGVLIGLVSARSSVFRAALDPLVLVGGTVPVLVAAPFFLIWFGTGRVVAYLIVGAYTMFTLIVFAQRAADNLDPVFEQNARTQGADRRQVLRTVLLPAVLPEVLGGVRIALAAGWGLAAIAELLGLPAGLGKVVQAFATTTDTEAIFAAILLLGVVAAVTDVIVATLLRRAFRWRGA